MDSDDRAVSLAPIPPAGVNLNASNLAVIHVPRRVLRHAIGTSLRLYDIHLEEEPAHVKDIVTYGLIVKTLTRRNFVKRVKAAYLINDPASPVITLVLELTCPLEAFAKAFVQQARENEVEIFGAEPEAPPDEDPEEQDDNGPGGGRGRGRGGRGGGRGRGGGKRKRPTADAAFAGVVRYAHDHLSGLTVPAFKIGISPHFRQKPMSWGTVVHGEEELSDLMLSYTLSRMRELDPSMPAVANYIQQSPAQTAADDADADDTDDMVAPKEAEQLACSFIYDVRLVDGTSHVVKVHPAELFKRSHEQLKALNTDALNNMYLVPAPGYFKFATAGLDLSHLSQRYIPPSPVFQHFQSFCERMAHEQQDNAVANPPGLSVCLSMYFDKNPDVLKDADASSTLVFDTLSRQNAALPKSVGQLFRTFHDTLVANKNCLAPLVAGKRQLGTGEDVIKFHNLTWSGNYLIYLMRHFELSGTFFFHTEQVVQLLTLGTASYRRRIGDRMADMAAHLIQFGPPNMGKSESMRLWLSAFPATLKATSYTSARSFYSTLKCADALDHKAHVYDECPYWIVDSESKASATQQQEIQQLKEVLTSGAMSGERLVRDETAGDWNTIDFNVLLECRPFVAHTNKAEDLGPVALLNRFIRRYFMKGARVVPHTLESNTPSDYSPDPLVKEMSMQSCIMMAVSKMQSDHIIPPVDLTVFTQFYSAFVDELGCNPFLNCDKPNTKDRQSSMVQLLFEQMTMRCAIHRVFFEPGAAALNQSFSLDHLLEIKKYIAYGDMQNVITAVSCMGHMYRSPTEYRAAQLCRTFILHNIAAQDRKEYPTGGPRAPEHRPGDWRSCYPVGQNNFDAADLDTLADRYVFLYRSNPLTGQNAGAAGMFKDCAERLMGFCTGGNIGKLEPDHLQQRLTLLSQKTVRCGPDKGLRVLVYKKVGNECIWFVLKSWLEDCTETRTYSLVKMVERATRAMSSTTPGTYLVLEPLQMRQLDEVPDGVDPDSYIPHLLPYVRVPVHEKDCPARDEAEEARPPAFFGAKNARDNCACFRSKGLVYFDGDTKAKVDPSVLCIQKCRAVVPGCFCPISHLRTSAAWAASSSYPADAVAAALSTQAAASVPVRDKPTAAEQAVMDEMERDCDCAVSV